MEINAKETLEEAFDKASLLEFPIKEWYRSDDYSREEITAARDGFKRGAKWKEQRSYSEEEVLILLHERDVHNMHFPSTFNKGWKTPKEWFKKK